MERYRILLFTGIITLASLTLFTSLFIISKRAGFESQAETTSIVEPESGVVSGNASIQNDTGNATSIGASGGKYVLLNSLTATPTPSGPTPTPLPGGWIEVGTHPHASKEYTAPYKALNTMVSWNFKLYTGLGNFSTHQGPVAIDSFDPLTKSFTYDGLPYTENIVHFRPSFGKLYVPTFNAMHTDRLETFNYTEPGKKWTEVGNLNLSYSKDIVSLTGKDVLLIGYVSDGYHVQHSPDGGVSWSIDVMRNTLGQLATYKNKLYVHTSTGTKIFDGTAWSTSPVALGNMTDPRIFKDKLVYISGGRLKAFDGTTVITPNTNFLSRYTVSGNKLYIHTAGTTRNIYATSDLVNWSLLTSFTAPASASMAVLHGKLYIGTTDSKIYELSTPVSTLPEVIVYATDDDASEVNNPGSFIVKRDGSTANALTISYTASGTASNGSDYASLSGSATIPAGSSQVTIPINPLNDGVTSEGNETVILTLNSTPQYDAVEPSKGIVTIHEKPSVYTETVDEIAGENSNPGSIRFVRKGDLTTPLTVTYSLAQHVDLNGRLFWTMAQNGSDFSIPTSITIPAGQNSTTLTIQPINDSLYEADEWVRLEVLPSSAYVRELPSRQLVKIEDNDSPSTPNLIANPGFEIEAGSNPGQVDRWGGAYDTTISRSGNASLRISGPTAELTLSYLRQNVPITPGKRYILSGWIRTDGELTGRGPTIRTAPAGDAYTQWVRNSNGNWKFVSASFTAGSTTTSTVVDLSWVINGPQRAWFDDVALHEAP